MERSCWKFIVPALHHAVQTCRRRAHHQGLAVLQAQLGETFVGDDGFDQLGVVIAFQFQLRQRTDGMRAAQLHHDAFGAGRVALHVEVMRTHETDPGRIADIVVAGRLEARTAGVEHAFMHAAMEQVHVAQEAVHEGRAGWLYTSRACRSAPPALVHQHHLVGHFQRFFLVVGDEDAGDVQFVMQAAQPAAQFLAHLGIERAEGFVQQQHARLHGQRAGQRDTLALAARELRRIAVGQPVQLHQLQQALDLLADDRLRGRCARLHAQAEGDVLEHRHVLEQRIVLEHEPTWRSRTWRAERLRHPAAPGPNRAIPGRR
jgi:hypothetical protein